MESIDFALGVNAPLTCNPNDSSLYVKAGVKTFADKPNAPHEMCQTKRFAIYNRQPTMLKFVHRSSRQGCDVELPSDLVQLSTVHYDLDVAIALLVDSTAVILKVEELPNGELRHSTVATINAETTAKAERCFAFQLPGTVHSASSAPMNGKALLFLNKAGNRTVLALDNLSVILAPAKGDIAIDDLDAVSVGFANGVVALPSAGKVRLVAASTFKPLISKAWFPHESGCSATKVLSSSQKGSAPRLITLSADYTEVRLWSLVSDPVALVQTINFTLPEGKKAVPRRVQTDKDENYVFLYQTGSATSTECNSLLVLELSEDRSVVVRITEWSVGGDESLLSLAPVLRKTNAQNKISVDMTIFVRTPTGVSRHVLDSAKLDGEPNIGTAADEAEEKKNSNASVKKWFAEPSSSAHATPASQTTPAIITSIQGGTRTSTAVMDNAAAERQTQEALARQEQVYNGTLNKIHASVLSMEKQANENLSVLRSAEAQKAAQAAGRSSGKNSAADIVTLARLGGNASKSASSPSAIGSGDEVRASADALDAFLVSIRGAISMTASQSLQANFAAFVGPSVDRSWSSQVKPAFDKRDDIPMPKMTQLPSMQQFTESIDKAHSMQNELFRRQKEQEAAKCRGITRKTQENAETTMEAGRDFLKALQQELGGLGTEVKECKKAFEASNVGGGAAASSSIAASAGPAPKESDDSAYAAAVKFAKAGEFKLAVQKIAQHGSIPVTMRFIGTEEVKASREDICSPKNLSLPSFLTLLQHVTHDMMSSTGMLPMRIDWAHALSIGMDEYLAAPPNKTESELINAASVDFSNVMDNLDAIDVKGSLDASSRRKLKLIRKVISAYAD